MTKFEIVRSGSGNAAEPVTPKNVPNRGGEPNPTAAALKEKFPSAVLRVEVVNGETNVLVETSKVLDIVRWLHDDDTQSYEYLSDVTAVEHRDLSLPIEVVWHLRSVKFRRFLRLKTLLPKGAKLEVPSVWPVYKGADWLERECYDMFGITFIGHPDLRRILLYDTFEGHPLRKDYPYRKRQPIVPEVDAIVKPIPMSR